MDLFSNYKKQVVDMEAEVACQKTLVDAALEVLNEPNPFLKAQIGEVAASQWRQGQISLPFLPSSSSDELPPDRPARLPTVKLVPSHMMPKLGKGGSLRSRQATLHSLVHTESWAIDLSWDIIARFGAKEGLPKGFYDDFVRVAQDEGRHFKLLAERLKELGSFYGAFPAHDGLWDSAIRTKDDLLARLAIEHCVHEARGLDVLPSIISRFRNGGDECTADILETVIYPEEITHCAAGVKWFRYFCTKRSNIPRCLNSSSQNLQLVSSDVDESDNNYETELVIPAFHKTVREYFRGPLKPPFNVEARQRAGFVSNWYIGDWTDSEAD